MLSSGEPKEKPLVSGSDLLTYGNFPEYRGKYVWGYKGKDDYGYQVGAAKPLLLGVNHTPDDKSPGINSPYFDEVISMMNNKRFADMGMYVHNCAGNGFCECSKTSLKKLFWLSSRKFRLKYATPVIRYINNNDSIFFRMFVYKCNYCGKLFEVPSPYVTIEDKLYFDYIYSDACPSIGRIDIHLKSREDIRLEEERAEAEASAAMERIFAENKEYLSKANEELDHVIQDRLKAMGISCESALSALTTDSLFLMNGLCRSFFQCDHIHKHEFFKDYYNSELFKRFASNLFLRTEFSREFDTTQSIPPSFTIVRHRHIDYGIPRRDESFIACLHYFDGVVAQGGIEYRCSALDEIKSWPDRLLYHRYSKLLAENKKIELCI